jgi:hypothetical protein
MKMPNQVPTAKAKLLADIDRTWADLNAQLGRLTDEQMTALQDHAGWTVKDHIVHIARWEQSVVFHLQGKPRWAGLGVDEALLASHNDDAENAVIQRQNRDLPLADALEQMRSTHQQMMALLRPLKDSKLDAPLQRMIAGNTSEHFAEHMPWIEALVNPTSRS